MIASLPRGKDLHGYVTKSFLKIKSPESTDTPSAQLRNAKHLPDFDEKLTFSELHRFIDRKQF